MDAENSLSKLEFHQILERYKAKALSNAKPTELTLIPEHVSPRGLLDTSTQQSPENHSKTIKSPGGMASMLQQERRTQQTRMREFLKSVLNTAQPYVEKNKYFSDYGKLKKLKKGETSHQKVRTTR